jgi:hypothetical protein
MNEAELKALFEQAVRAIGFYEAQRKEVLMALESFRRALKNRPPNRGQEIGVSQRAFERSARKQQTLEEVLGLVGLIFVVPFVHGCVHGRWNSGGRYKAPRRGRNVSGGASRLP